MADGSTYKVYLNGSLVGSKTAAVSPITSANKLVLGVDFTFVSGRNFNGQMLDVRIYHRVVSENEIRILASRRGIAYELAPRRRSRVSVLASLRYNIFTGNVGSLEVIGAS
jgi:DhnA family fructose-bisphosphate aldolase class Ia